MAGSQTTRLVENGQQQVVIVPVDLSGGANNGAWVSLAGFDTAEIDLAMGAPAALATGNTCVITIKQATDTTGTGSKALNVTDVYTKSGADITAVGTFTKTVQAAANTVTVTAATDVNEKHVVIPIRAEELDVENGFKAVQASIADVGTVAQIGGVEVILTNPRFAGANVTSAL